MIAVFAPFHLDTPPRGEPPPDHDAEFRLAFREFTIALAHRLRFLSRREAAGVLRDAAHVLEQREASP